VAKVCKHGLKQCVKRLGLKKKAVKGLVEKAYEFGLGQKDFRGKFKRYLDKLYFSEGSANTVKVYNQYLFFFYDDTLITAYRIPTHLQKYKPKEIKNELHKAGIQRI